MRRLLLLAPLLLGAGPAAPRAALAGGESKAIQDAAEARATLAVWALRNKMPVRARWAYEAALLWDPGREDWKKALAAIPIDEADANDAKLQYEVQDRLTARNKADAKAFLKLADQAVKARFFGTARRLAARVHDLEAGAEGLEGIRKALEGKEGAGVLKALDAGIAQARSSHFLRPASKDSPECLLKLPRDYDPADSRSPVLVFLPGKALSPGDLAGAFESFRAAGFAVLVHACESRLGRCSAREDAERVLAERLLLELGLDPRRLFLAAQGSSGDAACAFLERHREHLGGLAFVDPELRTAVIERIPKPDALPILVVQEGKSAVLEGLQRARYSGAVQETAGGATRDDLDRIEPRLLAFCQGILGRIPPDKRPDGE